MYKTLLPASALLAAITLAAAPGNAQTAPNANQLGGVGTTHTVTVRAKVRSVNMKTREVTLVGPEGDAFTLHAGDNVQNLAQVKKGDTVVATFTRSSVIVLNGPGQPTPPNTMTVTGGRSAPGQPPAAEARGRLVITGTVVGIDMEDHTLQLVNPKGGRVITLDVTDPERQAQMASVHVGDSLTVVYTEGVALSLEEAH